MPGLRHLLLCDLIDDAAAIARYETWHAAGQVPPPIVRRIRDAGITSMEIYRLGTRLVMLLETGPDYDPAARAVADAADPDVRAWEALMGTMQRPVPGAPAGAKWAEAARIFSLDAQL